MATTERNRRRVSQGVVVSSKMDKTITVLVERNYKHPKYHKYLRRHTKYHAHDEQNEASVGDRVEIMECRPLSKQKRFRLVRVIERPVLRGEQALAPEPVEQEVAEVTGAEQSGGLDS